MYETIMDSDITLLLYVNRQPLHNMQPSNQTINSTLEEATELLPEVHIYQAIVAFLLVILVYFCLLYQAWAEHVEGNPEDINRSLVRKVSTTTYDLDTMKTKNILLNT